MDPLNFKKYDELDAKEAHEFLAALDDPDTLRAYVAHEKGDKDRSTVLTDEIIDEAVKPSIVPEIDIPTGVTPGETPGWPIDSEGAPLNLPDSVRAELATAAAEVDALRAQEGATVNSTDEDVQTRETIAALLEERRGYEQHGKDEKVAEVNAELKRLGHKGKAPAKRATTR